MNDQPKPVRFSLRQLLATITACCILFVLTGPIALALILIVGAQIALLTGLKALLDRNSDE